MAQTPKDPSDHDPGAVAWAREQAGLTKTEAARRLRVSLSLISMIESGKRNAGSELIESMAGLYDCSPDDLRRKDGQPATRLAVICTGCSELWGPDHQCPNARKAAA